MADKHRFSKRGYLSYFVKNAAGEYIYSGKLYSLEGGKYGPFTAAVALLSVGAFLLCVASGCITAPGMTDCFYVIIPFVLEIAASVSVLWASVRLAGSKKPLREYVYDSSVKSLPLRCVLTVSASLAGMVCETVYAVLNGTGENTVWFVVFLLLKAGSAACAFILRFRVRKSVWISTNS